MCGFYKNFISSRTAVHVAPSSDEGRKYQKEKSFLQFFPHLVTNYRSTKIVFYTLPRLVCHLSPVDGATCMYRNYLTGIN